MVLSRHAAQHLFATPMFADGEGRRGKIDDCVRAGLNELFDWIVAIPAALPEVAIVPDVFADADAEAVAAQMQNLRTAVPLGAPVLVEDVVGRQQRLAKALADAAPVQQRARTAAC